MDVNGEETVNQEVNQKPKLTFDEYLKQEAEKQVLREKTLLQMVADSFINANDDGLALV